MEKYAAVHTEGMVIPELHKQVNINNDWNEVIYDKFRDQGFGKNKIDLLLTRNR